MSERDAEDLFRDPQEPETKRPDFLDDIPKTNDPKRLEKKELDDKALALRNETDLRVVLSTTEGRRFVALVMMRICHCDQPYYHPHNGEMSNVAGRREVARTLEQLIRDADFELWVAVDREIENLRLKPKSAEKARSRPRPN